MVETLKILILFQKRNLWQARDVGFGLLKFQTQCVKRSVWAMHLRGSENANLAWYVVGHNSRKIYLLLDT